MKVAISLLILLTILTIPTAAQQKRQTPAKPQPKPAAAPIYAQSGYYYIRAWNRFKGWSYEYDETLIARAKADSDTPGRLA